MCVCVCVHGHLCVCVLLGGVCPGEHVPVFAYMARGMRGCSVCANLTHVGETLEGGEEEAPLFQEDRVMAEGGSGPVSKAAWPHAESGPGTVVIWT